MNVIFFPLPVHPSRSDLWTRSPTGKNGRREEDGLSILLAFPFSLQFDTNHRGRLRGSFLHLFERDGNRRKREGVGEEEGGGEGVSATCGSHAGGDAGVTSAERGMARKRRKCTEGKEKCGQRETSEAVRPQKWEGP